MQKLRVNCFQFDSHLKKTKETTPSGDCIDDHGIQEGYEISERSVSPTPENRSKTGLIEMRLGDLKGAGPGLTQEEAEILPMLLERR